MTYAHPTATGRRLTLHLINGTPSGVTTADLGDSLILAAAASQTDLLELIKLEEASRTGIYLLAGQDPDSSSRRDRVYVGESNKVGGRLRRHDSEDDKNFFTRAVFVVAKDKSLTKAHVRYLEHCLISKIENADRAVLDNKTVPESSDLPKPEVDVMTHFLNDIEILLPVLGFDVLRPAGEPVQTVPETNLSKPERIFKYIGIGKTIKARAKESGGEFILLKGSQVNQNEVPSCRPAIRRRREDALEIRDLEEISGDEEHWQTTRDLVFGSPSAAAGFVYGGPTRGPESWKHEASGKTYAELRAAESSQV